jgi:hypothetical protein
MIVPALLALMTVVQLASAPAPATTTAPADAREVVLSSRLDDRRILRVIRVGVRPATRPATTTPAARGSRVVYPDFDELYEVHLVAQIDDDHADGDDAATTVLWRYRRSWFKDMSSPRLRYRVLAVALIDGDVYLAEKQMLSTSVLKVRPGDGATEGAVVGVSRVLTDSEVDGPIVVSATFRAGPTIAESSLILNHDQDAKSRREWGLAELFDDDRGHDERK